MRGFPGAAARIAALLTLLVATAAQAAEAQIGQVAQSTGGVSARAVDGAQRTLNRGAAVFRGDRISTGANASVQIAFDDGGRMTLGAQTDASMSEYRGGNDGGFIAHIAKGVFRYVTGTIGKGNPRGTAISTTVATAGVRGTHFAGAATETSAVFVLLEPEDKQPTAIEVSNQFGAVTIDRPDFGTEIPDANSPPSPPRRMRLRAVDNLIRSFGAFPR